MAERKVRAYLSPGRGKRGPDGNGEPRFKIKPLMADLVPDRSLSSRDILII